MLHMQDKVYFKIVKSRNAGAGSSVHSLNDLLVRASIKMLGKQGRNKHASGPGMLIDDLE